MPEARDSVLLSDV
jgi:serine/threonine protein kinase